MFTMDRARWLQLEPLLDEVLELSREEQGPWLEALQRGAPEDAADLRRLLLIEVVAEEEQFLQRTREPTLLAVTRAVGDVRGADSDSARTTPR